MLADDSSYRLEMSKPCKCMEYQNASEFKGLYMYFISSVSFGQGSLAFVLIMIFTLSLWFSGYSFIRVFSSTCVSMKYARAFKIIGR